jgi:hypothetical protein
MVSSGLLRRENLKSYIVIIIGQFGRKSDRPDSFYITHKVNFFTA